MNRFQLAEALIPYLPDGKTVSNIAVHNMEKPPGMASKSTVPSRNVFGGEDPIDVYGRVFRAQSKELGDWFDVNAEHFRQLLLERMVNRPGANKGNGGIADRWNSSRVKDCPVPGFWEEYAKKLTEAGHELKR